MRGAVLSSWQLLLGAIILIVVIYLAVVAKGGGFNLGAVSSFFGQNFARQMEQFISSFQIA